MLTIDHVIYGTHDLDSASRKFSQLGFESVFGGAHPAFGTANRIIPLDDCYIELMGIADPAVAKESVVGQWLIKSTSRGDAFMGLCLATDDIEAIARRLCLEIIPGLRVKPDGTELTWRLAGIDAALHADLPFFISWDQPEHHPSRDPVSKISQRKSSIVWVEMLGDETAIREWVGADVGIRYGKGKGIRAIGVSMHGEEIEIT